MVSFSWMLLIFAVIILVKRAERQRRDDALQLSQLTFDALPDDAKERVREAERERAEAARAARAARTAAYEAELERHGRLAKAFFVVMLIYVSMVALGVVSG